MFCGGRPRPAGLGGVCVGNGLAIPHAKKPAVRQLQLAALTLDPPLPLRHTGRQAAGPAGDDRRPRRSPTTCATGAGRAGDALSGHRFLRPPAERWGPRAFCRAISAREEQDAQSRRLPPSDAAPGAAESGYQLLAVTACPHHGIAHTYLSAGGASKLRKARGLTLKVETNGAAGVNDEADR